jgi:hypothetical protein
LFDTDKDNEISLGEFEKMMSKYFDRSNHVITKEDIDIKGMSEEVK